MFAQERLQREYKSTENDLLQVREQLSLVENLSIFKADEGEAQFRSIEELMKKKLERIELQIETYPSNSKAWRMQLKEKQLTTVELPDGEVTSKVSLLPIDPARGLGMCCRV